MSIWEEPVVCSVCVSPFLPAPWWLCLCIDFKSSGCGQGLCAAVTFWGWHLGTTRDDPGWSNLIWLLVPAANMLFLNSTTHKFRGLHLVCRPGLVHSENFMWGNFGGCFSTYLKGFIPGLLAPAISPRVFYSSGWKSCFKSTCRGWMLWCSVDKRQIWLTIPTSTPVSTWYVIQAGLKFENLLPRPPEFRDDKYEPLYPSWSSLEHPFPVWL